MKLLRVVFFIELVLGVLWLYPLVTVANPGLGIVMLFLWTAPLHLAFMVTGVVYFVRKRETRRLAAAVFCTPVVVVLRSRLIPPCSGARPPPLFWRCSFCCPTRWRMRCPPARSAAPG